MEDRIRKLYIDQPSWDLPIKTDDFIIAIGTTRSNSVYHVLESMPKLKSESRITRYHLKVFKTDLLCALRRESNQNIIPMSWYPRNKKHKLK